MGLIFLLLAIIGMLLPLLPTTPFALLAIYFFDRSSKKFHRWCLKIPGIGEGIRDWTKYKIIRKKAKIQALVLLAISGVVVSLKNHLSFSVKMTTISILLGVLIFLWSKPSMPKVNGKSKMKKI